MDRALAKPSGFGVGWLYCPPSYADVAVAGHGVELRDVMQLALDEETDGRPDRLVRRRAEAKLVTPFLEVAAADDEFLRHDRLAVVADPVGARPEHAIVEDRVVAVVRDRVRGALHVAARIDEVEVAELAFDRQGGLIPGVRRALRAEVRELQVADRGVVTEEAVRW